MEMFIKKLKSYKNMGKEKMRQWGMATRDLADDKLDFEGCLSPLVLQEFAKYMKLHEKTANGNRKSDNWQAGIPKDVYVKSLWRHFFSFWSIHRGYRQFDKKDNHEIDIIEAGVAMIFNLQGYLHEYLKENNFKVLDLDKKYSRYV